ncbi:rRNA pseudouridine synthase [Mucilaginibacter sp. RB4R14]|uniref:pseudouridine synthase n=1 Tax=Mucilaginibacter aurantiaciroseus TaxID=2949308 RepID=UPI002090ED5E|nr:pseudouridine synthase [Mucilaginibacter aurantiaciroseus]MCO5937173.1 rRNA pseudouridine synthase [Mucilaginibacter aurantiaciroseus]
MVFKRPAGSRDDRPNNSQNRSKSGGENGKRPSSSSTGKSFGAGRTDGKKNFSVDKRESTYSKPKTGKPDTEGTDRPKKAYGQPSSFSGGDKKAFVPKGRPYTGRPADNDRPKRSFGGDAPQGDRKSFTPRDKPYSGRTPGGDSEGGSTFRKPGLGPASYGPRKNPVAGDKPFNRRPAGTDGSGGPKKSFGEKKFNNTRGGVKDFPSTSTGLRKREGDDAPAKPTMRGRKNPVVKPKDDGLIRLNRYIANAGICSRRKADELIAAGVVSVNGEVISELGHKVDPLKDLVRYNGEALKREKNVYVLLNKPKDYITTTDDPQERRTVMHLVEKASRERIYPVGRLDRNTTGLILMTNDGDLADKLSHPRNSVTKLYLVELNKALSQGDLNKIEFGVELEDGVIKPDSVSYVTGGTKKEIGIQIHSGKNRVVRRIFESLGYDVVKLDRSVYANLTKKDLPRGRWRYLDEKEVIQLKHLIK